MDRVAEPVDLRSDTVTRPGPQMRRAMAEAVVGDDVYGEDPSVNLLQERVAAILGKEAALFVPSGTMANQVCLRTLAGPGDEIIAHEGSHLFSYEGGAAAALSGLQVRPLSGVWGVLDPRDVEGAVRPPGEHFARTRVVAIENTHNSCGGTIWPLESMQAVGGVAARHGLAVHLDGARLWNAHVASGIRTADFAAVADSVSVCFSKGLGAPAGSVIAGTAAFVSEARYNRKRFGGGMRQAGVLAAAALWALDHNLSRLSADHDNAALLARLLREIPGLQIPHPVQTNIVVADLSGIGPVAVEAAAGLKEEGVLCTVFSDHLIRFVTHLDVDSKQVEFAGKAGARVLSAIGDRAGADRAGADRVGADR